MQCTAGFHAERARVKLIQRQIFRGSVYLSLSGGGAFFLARAGDEVDEDNQLAEADTKRFDEHVESLTVLIKKGAQLTRFFTGEKKPAINAGSFLLRIT
jgi:riboflavin synthase